MRKIVLGVASAAALLAGVVVVAQAGAAPVPPPVADQLPPEWTVDGRELVWTAPDRVTGGSAAVEFYSGDRLLGRARGDSGLRTYRIPLPSRLDDLQVRAAGRRLDAEERPDRAPRPGAPPARPLPAADADPGVPGSFATTTSDYDLPGLKLPELPVAVEMRAVVVGPRNAPGPRPLVLFVHGQAATCVDGDSQTTDWPCPPGTTEIPSHRGFLYAQRLLASQGYLTASVSVNGVNAQGGSTRDAGTAARSAVIRAHLAHWAKQRNADLNRVLLVGHSRGGEAVNRAALDSLTATGWTIRGTVLVAPTAFGQNPAADVPSATLLPACDGDLSDRQGQNYVDGTRGVGAGRALHSALHVEGANHNYFNSEWTPGESVAPSYDDARYGEPGTLCAPDSPGRLTAAQQRAVGATYLAASARVFLDGDAGALPLIDGSGVRAPSAGPARVLSHAVGGARTPVLVPGPSVTAGGSARLCDAVTSTAEAACLDGRGSPHFVPFGGVRDEPGRQAIRLDGTAAATLRPAAPVSLAGATDLALRVIVPPNTTGNRFGVAVTGRGGERADLGEVSLDGLPGTDYTASHWAQEVRVRLPRGTSPAELASLELTPRQDGPAWLLDAWGWRAGLPAPGRTSPARVDVGTLTVDEGDSGTVTHRVPVEVTGTASGQVRLFLTDPVTFAQRSWTADVTPGMRRIEVPVEVAGDTAYGSPLTWYVSVKAVRNTVVGTYEGGLEVREDDPLPAMTVTPSPATAAEGSPLTWTVALSEAASTTLAASFEIRVPATGPELSTTDVDPGWYRRNTGDDAVPSRPLSGTPLSIFVTIPPGETSAVFSVPTLADGENEGTEHIRWQVSRPSDDGPTPVALADGDVTDA